MIQGVIESEETVSKDESKTSRNNGKATVRRKRGCKRNNRNNACKRNLELVMKSRFEDPKRSTYSCRPEKSSQNQLYVKHHNVDKMAESPPKQRHDNIAKVVHWKLREKCHLERKMKKKKRQWYEQVPDSSSETMKLHYCQWDTNI